MISSPQRYTEDDSWETNLTEPNPSAAQVGWLSRYFDLIIVGLLAALLPVLVGLEVTPWLRIPLGVGLVLLAPGYVLSEALFLDRYENDGAIRLALSFGLSIVVVPLLAVILSLTPLGFQMWPVTLVLAVWIIAVGLIAARRRQSPVVAAPKAFLKRAGQMEMDARTLAWVAGVLVAVGALAYTMAIVLLPDANQNLTEFYALGSQGMAQEYPRQVSPDAPVAVKLGIRNSEGQTASYRIEVRSANKTLLKAGPITVKDGTSWEQEVIFKLDALGDDQRVDILLFYGNSPTVYRQLRLWVNVK